MIEILYELDYEEKYINSAILEINKAFHKDLTNLLRIYREENQISSINNIERMKIEQYFYYDYLNGNKSDDYDKLNIVFDKYFKKEDKMNKALQESIEYLNKRIKKSEKDKKNIMDSLITRINNKGSLEYFAKTSKKYMEYIESKEYGLYQLSILNLKATGDNEKDLNIALSFLEDIYDKLANYHYASIIFENSNDSSIAWETIAKTAIFAENFKESKEFPPFNRNKKKQVKTLAEYLKNNKYLNIEYDDIIKIVSGFYEYQSYGFIFSDLLVSEDLNKKVLILQKIEYDSTNVLCPDCLDDNPMGNSYSKVSFKSFECANSHCISRSKSGRGKRYNYLSAKINTKMNYLNSKDKIPYDMYRSFRRDIYSSDLNEIEMLIRFYSFTKDNVAYYKNSNKENVETLSRNIKTKIINNSKPNKSFNELRIFNFLENIKPYIKKTNETKKVNNSIEIVNADSTEFIRTIEKGSFDNVVTSPPYYNAREYSQWPSLISYLVDMFINSYYINKKINDNGVYLYNIGDIVDQDNIYVPSNMSKRKQILGLYSILIFELAGWMNKGNIIWDKGEVQSKRNSTANLSPYYVKPINCYEYVWIFTKNNDFNYYESIEKINPVIKINSLGENLAQHSAPYPLELVNLISRFIEPNSIVLDPFLGSGTTALWCLQNGFRCIGVELNKKFYLLSKDRLNLNTQMSFI